MVNIDTSKIPESEVKLLAVGLIEAAKRFYSNPKNVLEFQEWKRRQQEQK